METSAQYQIIGDMCREGDVSGHTAYALKERLPEILRRYFKEYFWNMEEMDEFWQALPDHGFGQKGVQCKGDKVSKKQLLLPFCISSWC